MQVSTKIVSVLFILLCSLIVWDNTYGEGLIEMGPDIINSMQAELYAISTQFLRMQHERNVVIERQSLLVQQQINENRKCVLEKERSEIEIASFNSHMQNSDTLTAKYNLLQREFIDNIMEDESELEQWQKRARQMETLLTTNQTAPLPLCFVHLPKTAGTSIFHVIERVFKRSEIIHYWLNPSEEMVNETLEMYQQDSIKVIGGHMGYGFHKWFTNPPLSQYTYFTVLREPTARVISHYLYHVKSPKDPNHTKAKDKTLMEWLRAVKFGNNIMTVLLCGAEYSAWWNQNETSFTLLPPNLDPPNEFIVTENHYKQARANLLSMFVFMQDNFDDSLMYFGDYLGVNITSMRHDNVLKERSGGGDEFVPTEADLAAIKMYNFWDEKLYRLGTLLFEQQILLHQIHYSSDIV